MSNKYLSIGSIVFLITLAPVFGAENGILWEKTYDGGSTDMAHGVILDSKDNVIVTGTSYDAQKRSRDYYTIKYNKSGDVIWEKRYDVGIRDVSYDVAVDSKDNVIVTGFSSNGADHRGRADYTYYTFKYDKNGKKLWHGKWATSHSYAEAYGIATDSQDNVIVTGFIMENNNRDYFTIKCDPSGNILWEDIYDRSFYDRAYGVATDQNDNIFVTGISYSRADNYDICTIKYSPEGKLQWEKILDINRNDIAEDVAVDSEGNILVVGSTDSRTWDFLTIKYQNK